MFLRKSLRKLALIPLGHRIVRLDFKVLFLYRWDCPYMTSITLSIICANLNMFIFSFNLKLKSSAFYLFWFLLKTLSFFQLWKLVEHISQDDLDSCPLYGHYPTTSVYACLILFYRNSHSNLIRKLLSIHFELEACSLLQESGIDFSHPLLKKCTTTYYCMW